MNDFPVSYREVIPNQTLPEKWKEFTLNTGGTQSTLQDIKGTQRAGGFYYYDQFKPYIGKRFIYWRMYDDVLELVEHSLDVNLIGNHVRYRFQDSPVLEGLTIHETSMMVVVLVSTVSSVHQLAFPHPERINKQEFAVTQHSEATVKSIFADASAATFRDPLSFHVINSSSSNTLLPHTSASWLCANNDILYALAYSSGAILLARHDAMNGTMTTTELNNKLTSRFLSGLTGALRGRPSEENVPASLIIHSMELDTYLFSLSRSGSLKAWSCSKLQCVMAADILDDAADSGKNMTLGAQSHVLRKACGNFRENELLLGVFLCFATSSECQFIVLQITCSNNVFRHTRLFSIHAPRGQDLVDFSLCRTDLWAVWRDNQGETVVSTVKISVSAYSNTQWESAILEPGPNREFVVTDPMTDPRQAYISYIFYPGRFSLPVIIKALSIFKRVPGFPLYDNMVSTEVLKSHVCQAVELEINNEASSYDLTDEEYLEVANRCWAKLYSCCVQYHVSSSRPIGLVLLPGGNQFGVALVNKAYVSLLRRTDVVETLFSCSPDRLSCSPFPGISADVSADILILVKLLKDLEEELSEEAKLSFELDLQRLNSPDEIAEVLVHDMLTRYSFDEEPDSQYLRTLQKELSRLKDAAVAMKVIIEALDQPHLKDLSVTGQDTSRHVLAVRFLFSSHMGISVLAETMRQIVSMRFNLCRNLLILQQIILQSKDEQASPDTVAQICTALVPRTVIWTQAYYALQWICQTPVSPSVKLNVLETNIQRMAILRLSDSTAGAFSIAAASVNGARSGPLPTQTLFELFLSTAGARHAQLLLGLNQQLGPTDVDPCWSTSILIFCSVLMHMMWPVNNTFIFPEFLMSSCQYLLVQEYVRLLNRWCQTNICSRKFLLGLAFLDMREPHKALDLLVEAANGITSEDFLQKKIVPSTEDCTVERLQIIYFLKVIQLFEQQNYPDYVIRLAEIAINLADEHDPDLPTLYSVAFVNHLRLDHPQEAFHSLNGNPDGARKKDCLKELVLTLLERRRLDLLLDFPYDNLSHDLERIVESRARSLDINNPIFYNFLYAFHVRKGNMRKAASTMYEQAMRLELEGAHGAATTERQVKCYLACLTSLELVDPRFSWIVKPVMNSPAEDASDSIQNDRMMSPKRNSDGDELQPSEWRRQVEVLEIADIRSEYEIMQCRLRLVRHSSEKFTRAGCMLSPVELLAVLCQVGMYQAAVNLARRHRLSCQPILESIASACVRLTVAGESPNREIVDAWGWLNTNDLSDLGTCDGSAVTLAWRFLESTLQRCEEDRKTVLHKSVATRLLGLGVFLPNWLVMSYKERNPAEFLRLLLGAGRLEEAAELGIEIIWAALGRGKERLGFTNALHVESPPLCLPHNTLHMLQLELQAAAREEPEYETLLKEFKPLYNNYLQKAASLSRDFEIAHRQDGKERLPSVL